MVPEGQKSKLCSQPSNEIIPIEKYVNSLVLKSVWEYLVYIFLYRFYKLALLLIYLTAKIMDARRVAFWQSKTNFAPILVFAACLALY